MPLRVPSTRDLERMAAANRFELNDEEAAAFQSLIPGMFGSFEILDQMPQPVQPLRYPDRDPGVRPTPEEDPFNAIVRRCSLRGSGSGKLAGKRIGLKNNVNVAGMPMELGSLLLEGYTPDTDATIVTWMLDEGAEIVAMLNLENFAFSGGGDTSARGPVRNPHNTDHLAGGSSGGSGAALYYDDIDITIGGDQGGSIRIPASWCGVVGLKPTHSLVPYTGIGGIDATFDHAGPMTRTVGDAALTLEVIAGKDPLDPRQREVPVQEYTQFLGRGVRDLRIGVVSEGFGTANAESDVDDAVRRAVTVFGELGAQVSEVSHSRTPGGRSSGVGSAGRGGHCLHPEQCDRPSSPGTLQSGSGRGPGQGSTGPGQRLAADAQVDPAHGQLHAGGVSREDVRQGPEPATSPAGHL